MIGAVSAALFTACGAGGHGAPAAPSAKQQVFHTALPAPAAAAMNHFTGRVRVERLSPAAGGLNASAGYVTFEPGARSAWHTHPAGQYLVVTAGTGWTQQWGEPAEALSTGDVVWCPPAVKHWHGATPTTSMTHLAVTGVMQGEAVSWLEPVSDAEYQTATAATLSATLAPAVTPAPLTARQEAIALLAAFMATSDLPRLNAALEEGLDAGLSIGEAKELLVQLYAYAGFPRCLNALGELMKVVEARRQRGAQDAPGREPSRPAPVGEALLAAGKANQTRVAGAPVGGPLFDFAPVANRFLQAHLFGDIFERDNVDWQSRELATVGALAATPGAEPQLRSHMAASLRLGLTVTQLRQLSGALAARVDVATGARASAALAQAEAALRP